MWTCLKGGGEFLAPAPDKIDPTPPMEVGVMDLEVAGEGVRFSFRDWADGDGVGGFGDAFPPPGALPDGLF